MTILILTLTWWNLVTVPQKLLWVEREDFQPRQGSLLSFSKWSRQHMPEHSGCKGILATDLFGDFKQQRKIYKTNNFYIDGKKTHAYY